MAHVKAAPSLLVSLAEACDMLRVGMRTLDRMRADGLVKTLHIGRRRLLRRSDVEGLAERPDLWSSTALRRPDSLTVVSPRAAKDGKDKKPRRRLKPAS
jgi:excisionase family DNA binding protein